MRGVDRNGTKVLPLLSAFGALSLAAPLPAHTTPWPANSTPTKRTTITGIVSKVDWINPHVYIHMDVADEKGEITTWRLESLPTAMLRKAGLTSEMIKGGGQKVTAAALMARNGTAELGVAAEPHV